MLRTKIVLILFTINLNYCIYGFVNTPIIKKYNAKINQNKLLSLNLFKFNRTNTFLNNTNSSNKIFKNIDEKLLLLLKTFTDVLLIYISLFNIFYIIYIVKHM